MQFNLHNSSMDFKFGLQGSTPFVTIGGDGKVGIGTTSPEGSLNVVSILDAEDDLSDGANYHLHLHNAGDDDDESIGLGFGISSAVDAIGASIGHERKGSSSYGDLWFATRPNGGSVTERVRITSAGNVGIGTYAPANTLDVAGAVGIGSSYAGNAAPSNGLIVQGNVGIGTTSPTVELDVVGTGIFSSKVGIGTTPTNALDVNGHLSATSKSFLIDHPTKENKKLQYASLEGPEHAVYVRGTHNGSLIELPEYWSELVHQDSITVLLTPLGKHQNLYVKSKDTNHISVGGVKGSYDYVVYGERKDIDKLEVEPPKV